MARTPLRAARENVAANLDPLDVALRMLAADLYLTDGIASQIRHATGNPTQARRTADRIAARIADLRTLTAELKQAHNDVIRAIRNAEKRLPDQHR